MNPRTIDAFTAVFCVSIFVLTGIEVIHFAREAHPWTVGDWAINYSQGFVRRGLIGELARQIAAHSWLPWIDVIVAIQVLSFGSILCCIYALLKRSSFIRWILFLVSPATLLFPVYSHDGGYRKEILLYAFLLAVTLAFLSRRNEPRHGPLLLLSVAALSFALVLAHEGLLLYFPYYVALALVLAKGRSVSYRYAFVLLPVLSGLMAFILSINAPGSADAARGICKSLGPVAQTTDICKGAIALLASNVHEGYEAVLWNIRERSYFKIYVTSTILASVPLVVYILGRRDHWRDGQFLLSIVVLPAVGVVTSLPLFLVGVDWGRFIHMHAMSIFIVILAYEATVTKDSSLRVCARAPWDWRAGLLCVVAAMYMTTWTLPHCCGNGVELELGAIGSRVKSHWLEMFVPLSAAGRRRG